MKKLFYSFVYWGIMCSRFWGGKSLVLVFVVAHSHAINYFDSGTAFNENENPI